MGCARACLYAFDLLHVGAEDLRGLALVERRALLREHLMGAGAAIIYSDHMTGADGEGGGLRLEAGDIVIGDSDIKRLSTIKAAKPPSWPGKAVSGFRIESMSSFQAERWRGGLRRRSDCTGR